MKIIRNKYIPFKGFRAINLFGILFETEDLSEVSGSVTETVKATETAIIDGENEVPVRTFVSGT